MLACVFYFPVTSKDIVVMKSHILRLNLLLLNLERKEINLTSFCSSNLTPVTSSVPHVGGPCGPSGSPKATLLRSNIALQLKVLDVEWRWRSLSGSWHFHRDNISLSRRTGSGSQPYKIQFALGHPCRLIGCIRLDTLFPAAPSASACSWSAPATGTASRWNGDSGRGERGWPETREARQWGCGSGGSDRETHRGHFVSARSATPLGCDPPSGHRCPGQTATSADTSSTNPRGIKDIWRRGAQQHRRRVPTIPPHGLAPCGVSELGRSLTLQRFIERQYKKNNELLLPQSTLQKRSLCYLLKMFPHHRER